MVLAKEVLLTEIKKVKEKKTHAYIYAIKHPSYSWNVYKIGKTANTPRNRMRTYETPHEEPPQYVLLFKIKVKSKLDKAETLLKNDFISQGRLAIPSKVRKEMFCFDSLEQLYSEFDRVLKAHKIGYIDLLTTKEYDHRGKDLKRGNGI